MKPALHGPCYTLRCDTSVFLLYHVYLHCWVLSCLGKPLQHLSWPSGHLCAEAGLGPQRAALWPQLFRRSKQALL